MKNSTSPTSNNASKYQFTDNKDGSKTLRSNDGSFSSTEYPDGSRVVYMKEDGFNNIIICEKISSDGSRILERIDRHNTYECLKIPTKSNKPTLISKALCLFK